MDKSEFLHQFGSAIAVAFNWNAFCSNDRIFLTQHEFGLSDLDRIFVARYTNADGKSVCWNTTAAISMSVHTAAKIVDGTFGFHEKAIEDFRAQVRRGDPLAGPIPVYALPDNQYFLMDGNHRMIAAAREQKGFPIKAIAVNGPIDEQFLPDLRHWSKSSTS